MTDSTLNLDGPDSVKRRSVVKAAAWAAPVVATAVAVPRISATVDPEPEEATSIGATTTSPQVGNVGRIRPFGIDPLGDDGFLPDGQTFTLASASLDFNTIITSITGGIITPDGEGLWLLTPNSGSVDVDIRFTSPVPGSYTLTSNGPVDMGQAWGGTVI